MSVLDLRPHDWPFGDLLPGKYSVILADPPWEFILRSKKGEKKSPQAHYPCMSLDKIMALPVGQLAAEDCLLVLWATAPMLPQAVQALRDWGFVYKTSGAWAKRSKTGMKWAFGGGFILRSAAEFYLLGVCGTPDYQSKSVRNLIEAPVREHSRKPSEIHRDIKRLVPHGHRCELFARETRPGWEVWGNQTDRFDSEDAA